MEGWKLPQLKAHRQYLLGKIEGVNLVVKEGLLDPSGVVDLLKQIRSSDDACKTYIAILEKEDAERRAKNRAVKTSGSGGLL